MQAFEAIVEGPFDGSGSGGRKDRRRDRQLGTMAVRVFSRRLSDNEAAYEIFQGDAKMNDKPDERARQLAAEMAAVLTKLWAEEIEDAIDKLKRPKRTATDQWFRKQFYREKWRMRNRKEPRITYD